MVFQIILSKLPILVLNFEHKILIASLSIILNLCFVTGLLEQPVKETLAHNVTAICECGHTKADKSKKVIG